MEQYVKILAIIAAREGSKGLPQKNVLDCAGKPLISWTIEAASQANHVDQVLVNTDSQAIADIAEQYGAWVPFLRPAELAQDESSIIDVINDVIMRLKRSQQQFDYVMLLQPTSPLRSAKHIDEAVEKYFETKVSDEDTLISVTQVDSKALWVMGEDDDSGYIFNHFDVNLSDNSRRQALPDCYVPNGAIYLAKVDGFQGFYGKQTRSYLMDEISSLDIDYQADLDRADDYLRNGPRAKKS